MGAGRALVGHVACCSMLPPPRLAGVQVGKAVGSEGLVAGQVVDIKSEGAGEKGEAGAAWRGGAGQGGDGRDACLAAWGAASVPLAALLPACCACCACCACPPFLACSHLLSRALTPGTRLSPPPTPHAPTPAMQSALRPCSTSTSTRPRRCWRRPWSAARSWAVPARWTSTACASTPAPSAWPSRWVGLCPDVQAGWEWGWGWAVGAPPRACAGTPAPSAWPSRWAASFTLPVSRLLCLPQAVWFAAPTFSDAWPSLPSLAGG